MFQGSLYLLKGKTDIEIKLRYEEPPQEGQKGYKLMKRLERLTLSRDRRDQTRRAWRSETREPEAGTVGQEVL